MYLSFLYLPIFLQLQIMVDIAERVRLERRHTGFIIARIHDIELFFREIHALCVRLFRIRHKLAQAITQILNHLLLIQLGQKCTEYISVYVVMESGIPECIAILIFSRSTAIFCNAMISPNYRQKIGLK